MTAMPDPTLSPLRPDSAAAGDPLEQWLGDLRTDSVTDDLVTDPADWITTGPAGEHPSSAAADGAAIPPPHQAGRSDTAADAISIGRHRRSD